MKFSPFSKLPEEGLKWLLVAYEYKASGWTDNNYEDCYLAFNKALPRGEVVSAEKFDALVRFWGDQKRTKTFDLARDPYSRYRMVPNKMLNTYQTRMGGSTKNKSELAQQSSFAKAYSKDISEVVRYTRKAMIGENFV